MCRRPICAEGDICRGSKGNDDCGLDEDAISGPGRGKCEKTITDRSEGDLWLFTDKR